MSRDFLEELLNAILDLNKSEAIKKRLAWYKDSVLPLVAVFEKEGILERVDGERPIKVIFEDIMARLKVDEKKN